MKKSIKNIAVAMILGTASTMAFATPHDSGAIDSGFRKGTAYTVEDDVYTLMNVNDWQKLQFSNFFGFIDVDGTANKGNFAVATHLKNKDVLGLAWEGNTWSDNSNNQFKGFYGWKNMGVQAYISETTGETYTVESPAGDVDFGGYKTFSLGGLFGMNVNEKIAFNAGAGMVFGGADASVGYQDMKLDVFTFALTGKFIYTFKEAKDLTVKGYAFYDGAYGSEKVKTEVEVFGQKNSVTATGAFGTHEFGVGVKAQYKPTNLFTYGFYLECPWDASVTTPDGGDSVKVCVWQLEMGNGLSFTLKPEKVYMNLGLLTKFPAITKVDDNDATFGNFENAYCGGLTFLVTPEIRIDLSTVFNPTNGLSFNEAWEQPFSISLRAKF